VLGFSNESEEFYEPAWSGDYTSIREVRGWQIRILVVLQAENYLQNANRDAFCEFSIAIMRI